MSFQMYNDQYLAILKGNHNHFKLKTQLKTDIAHFLHAVARWECIKKAISRVQELYKRCVGFMTSIDNLNDFTEFLKNLFIVAKSKMHHDKCSDALKYLIERIKTYKFDTDTSSATSNEEYVIEVIDENIDDISDSETSIFSFIETIKVSVDINESFTSIDFQTPSNDHFLPEFIELFGNLCKEFPCWTNVMNSHFDNHRTVSTSARSEAYFGDVKSSVLENRMPLRLDKFLIKHCRQLESDMKVARAAVKNLYDAQLMDKKLKLKNEKKQIIKNDDDNLFKSERWKNKYYIIEPEEDDEIFDISNEPNYDVINLDHSYSSLKLLNKSDEVKNTSDVKEKKDPSNYFNTSINNIMEFDTNIQAS